MYSNKETLEMAAFIARLASAADAAYADGKVNILDGYLILDPLKIVATAVQGADLIPKEVTDLSEAELLEIQNLVAAELELRSDFAKEITLDVVGIVGKMAVLLSKIKAHRTTVSPDPNPVDEIEGDVFEDVQ